MNSNLRSCCLILLFFFTGCKAGFSQANNDELIEQILESIAPNFSEDHDYSEITERLNSYRKNPLNLNLAGKEQLQDLYFISPLQINSIMVHREKNGLFLDVLELQSLPGFDPQTVRWLMNFVEVVPPGRLASASVKKLLAKAEHDLILRFGQVLEKQSGFSASGLNEDQKYAGSAMRMFTRYRYNYSNTLFASVNLEKDAGEPSFQGIGNKGFDFYSANISYKGNGMIRKLIAGDYALQFGQGLTMWAGSGFGKGAGLSTIAKQDIGLRPYSSANEALFLRGISATIGLRKISFTPFYSGREIDASLSDSLQEISSMAVSGLHRTKTEILNKNAASQRVYGANIQYSSKDLSIGLTALHTRFSLPFGPGKSLYQQYNFRGSSLSNIGLHFSQTYKNTYVFAEVAHSLNSGYAFLNGLISSLAPRISWVLLYRNYAKNYHSFFNQAVSEASNSVNERGVYSGLAIKLSSKWELFTYSDFFKFPWLKFRVDGPSSGYELFAQISYTPNKQFKLTGRFKEQIKEENSDENIAGLDAVDKQNFRIEVSCRLNDDFTVRNRAEIIRYHKQPSEPEFGYLNFQDIIYDPLSSKFSGNIRFAIFETSGFNSRIYSFENDVLYSYSVPAYQGKGIRFYVNGRYTIARGLDIWLRYALVNYSDQQTIGSGGDLINGNQRSDVRIQLRYQF